MSTVQHEVTKQKKIPWVEPLTDNEVDRLRKLVDHALRNENIRICCGHDYLGILESTQKSK